LFAQQISNPGIRHPFRFSPSQAISGLRIILGTNGPVAGFTTTKHV
jgi:hypothetical protein